MTRNTFGGVCYRCSKWVAPGEGHFERFRGHWRVQHATCAIEFRNTPDPDREADQLARRLRLAKGTGKSAQKARKRLRDEGKL